MVPRTTPASWRSRSASCTATAHIFEITTDAVVRTASAKMSAGGKRLFGYVNGDLMYAFDMAAIGQELSRTRTPG